MSTAEQKTNNQKNIAYYSILFTELNISSTRQRGNAYYKPILILSVMDLISQGIINENQITVSDDLINTFNKYWQILGSSSYKGGLHYPFLHLQSEGFWHLTFKAGFNGMQPKTINKLKEAVEYATLDDELFNYLQEPITRIELLDALVSAWFSSNAKQVAEILEINQEFQNITQEEIIKERDNEENIPKIILKKSLVRNAFFRKSVVYAYDYRCAFCRLKITRTLNQNIVDGAHIKPFAQFYDSRINNGLSLCKNHHWAFDQGWFTIDDDYKIIIANDLEEESPNTKPMKDFHSEIILLPSSEQYYPRLEALQWHRQNIFKAE